MATRWKLPKFGVPYHDFTIQQDGAYNLFAFVTSNDTRGGVRILKLAYDAQSGKYADRWEEMHPPEGAYTRENSTKQRGSLRGPHGYACNVYDLADGTPVLDLIPGWVRWPSQDPRFP